MRTMTTPQIMVITHATSDTISFNSYVNFSHEGSQIGQLDWYLNGLWMGNGNSLDIFFAEPGWSTIQAIGTSGMCSDTLQHHMYVEDELKNTHPISLFT